MLVARRWVNRDLHNIATTIIQHDWQSGVPQECTSSSTTGTAGSRNRRDIQTYPPGTLYYLGLGHSKTKGQCLGTSTHHGETSTTTVPIRSTLHYISLLDRRAFTTVYLSSQMILHHLTRRYESALDCCIRQASSNEDPRII